MRRGRRGPGPIASAVDAGDYSEIVIISDQKRSTNSAYGTWLSARGARKVGFRSVKLSSPTDFGEIYTAAVAAVDHKMEDK